MATRVTAHIKMAPPSFNTFLKEKGKKFGFSIVGTVNPRMYYEYYREDGVKFCVYEDDRRANVVQLYVHRGDIPVKLPAWLAQLLNEYEHYLNEWTNDPMEVSVEIVYYLI